jgi:cob(I)alamin adenosyltransferase
MSVYTGRGDDGTTELRDRSTVSKTSPRIEAYGTVDELNALLGTIRPTGHDDVDDRLAAIQDHLHIVQAVLATPDPDEPRVRERHTDRLEEWIDEADAELDPLESFILPGGSDAGSRLHHSRTVCRRAERRAVEIAGIDPVDDRAITYLNRLSDALFTFARLVNEREGVAEESPTY